MKVWVNGCFDILHVGHLEILEHAKNFAHGDNYLVVGLDTDERVRESKGDSRPINTLEDRMRMIASLEIVDRVVAFGTDDQLIGQLVDNQIDYIVVGEEYRDNVVGMHDVGGVEYFNRIGDYSTTNIINK